MAFYIITIGINTGGFCIGFCSITGTQLDIWGNTVNLCSRIEAGGLANRVAIGPDTYALIKDFVQVFLSP